MVHKRALLVLCARRRPSRGSRSRRCMPVRVTRSDCPGWLRGAWHRRAANACPPRTNPIKLVAMADVFENQLKSSYDA